MGIDVPSLQLLCCAKSIGVDFCETMMIGRQHVNLRPVDVATIMAASGIPREQTSAILEGQFAEPLFALLGAKQVSSVDVSHYEQATHIHDFNLPLPKSLTNRFSAVHDGGTIEHVFNIPQAFKNCMKMLRVGGHFIQINNANNCMGHGFWQFCPELIYRIFSEENGFRIKTVLLHEPDMMRWTGASFGTWYKVDDPAAHHCRVGLVNDRPTYICTIAQRVEDRKIFERFPQQSDYVDAWDQSQTSRDKVYVEALKQARESHYGIRLSSTEFSIRQIIPRAIKKLLHWRSDASKMTATPFNQLYYHRISDADVIHGRL